MQLTGRMQAQIATPLTTEVAGVATPEARSRPADARDAVAEHDPDALLAAAAASGNRDAYALLYQRHATGVYRYMLAHVGSIADAQDLTAQTFLAGLEGIAGFAGRGKFVAWLFGIARRKAMDHFRAARRTIPLNELEDAADPDGQPDELAEARLDFAELAAAIHTLAPDRAEAISLRIFAELSISDTAHLMGKSEAAVRMLLSRAVHDLRRRVLSPETRA